MEYEKMTKSHNSVIYNLQSNGTVSKYLDISEKQNVTHSRKFGTIFLHSIKSRTQNETAYNISVLFYRFFQVIEENFNLLKSFPMRKEQYIFSKDLLTDNESLLDWIHTCNICSCIIYSNKWNLSIHSYIHKYVQNTDTLLLKLTHNLIL